MGKKFTFAGIDFDIHLPGTREEGIQEIKETREKLGEFTLRDFMEAIYGDEYTRVVLGESGGQIKMKNVETKIGMGKDGLSTKISKDQLRSILKEAHPFKTDNQIDEMLNTDTASNKNKQKQILERREAEVEQEKIETAFNDLTPEEKAQFMKMFKVLKAMKD